MCEVCEIMKEFEKAGRDLSFRISQHAHALVIGNADEASMSEASTVNALHSILNIQKRMIVMAEKLGKTDNLVDFLRKGDKKSPLH